MKSPCRDVCRLNSNNWCDTCGRTAGEIGEWLASTEARKKEIIKLAKKRKKGEH